MAIEVLPVSEGMLQEVIEIITQGISYTRDRTDIRQEVRDYLKRWCDEEQEYLEEIK
jgi:hypothetical protein